ncbi:hypothetical protein P1X15_29740 [Runella sp. MFBS21]|uniref:hypothetical protein n=1 Tax=Runella sp. MFBS21 TaxID=3034018 RepID=UPI0023F96031|nr:hypothetical protein [Runella sp. MFBS21]MDF7821835.1 hypothetical protein [Runella sp. MFBS21]
MYAALITSSNSQIRNRALAGSIFLSTALLATLWLVKLHVSTPITHQTKAVIDTVELLAWVPMRIEVSPKTQPVSHPTSSGAAPAPRFAPKPTPARPSASEIRGTAQPVVTQTNESPVETPKIEPSSLYKKTEHRGSGNDPKANTNHGGAPNGEPTGGYDGPSKGKGGIGLDLAGFRFGKMSVPQDPYDETGRIVFRIKVNAEGEILALTILETSVSASIAQWYKQQLSKLTVVPTSQGQRPEVSEGRVTIKITAR